MARIRIPAALSRFTQSQDSITIKGFTLSEVIRNLVTEYPELEPYVFEEGQYAHYLSIYLNERNIRELNPINTTITPQDELTLLPAMAGG